MSEVVTSYYLRLRVADQAGVLAKVAGLLADAGISIDAMLQREASAVGGQGSTQTDLILLTHSVREGTMNEVIAQMQGLATVLAPITRIRKEELEPEHESDLTLNLDRGPCCTSPPAATRDRKHFCEILLEGLAPDGGLYLPEHYPQVDAATLASGAACPMPTSPSRSCRSTSTTSRPRTCARSRQDLHRAGVRHEARSCRCKQLEAGVFLEALSNGPTLAFKDMAMQLLGNLFEYELARRGEELNILGATSGDTGSAAEYAMRGKHGVQRLHALAARPHEPVPAGADVQPAGREHPQPRDRGRVRRLPGHRQGGVERPGVQARAPHRHGQLDQLGAAASRRSSTTSPATSRPRSSNDETRELRRAVGQLRQHLRRPRRAHDGPADRAARAGHQRERRARRVLPHRRLSRARQQGHATRPRAPRWTSPRPATSSASCSTWSAATARSVRYLFAEELRPRAVHARRRGVRSAREQYGFVSGRSTHADRLATIRDTYERFGTMIDTHTADGLKVAREHPSAACR